MQSKRTKISPGPGHFGDVHVDLHTMLACAWGTLGSSQNLILKLLGMLAISQFKARFQARKQF